MVGSQAWEASYSGAVAVRFGANNVADARHRRWFIVKLPHGNGYGIVIVRCLQGEAIGDIHGGLGGGIML